MLGVEFRPRALVCLKAPSDSNFPVFGEIQHIIISEDSKIFLIQVYETDFFSHHFNSYCIKNTTTYTIIDVRSLKMHQVFHKYYIRSTIYVTIRSCNTVELNV